VLTTSQNPVGDLISVPFQNNVNFPIGQFSRIQDVLNIQPVVPIHVSEDWLVFHVGSHLSCISRTWDLVAGRVVLQPP
jgi:hypothetical protein